MNAMLPPLSLYVHLPWCERKCPYCDFNSYQASTGFQEERYTAALLADLSLAAEAGAARGLSSIFFGGGTPSLFGAASIARILEAAEQTLGFAPDIEITLEANPGSAEQGRFAGYRAAGVNRLSIGIQSLRDEKLAALGRVHTADEARAAVGAAHAAGFDNVNLDLMFGLPDDTPSGAMFDLDGVLALGPAHVSWYQLTLEPNTNFAARPPALPDEDLLLEIEQSGRERLIASGFSRYEISAWAGSGGPSAHNLNYWRFGDYLGIGAGAHGKVSVVPQNDEAPRYYRTERARQPERFMREALAGVRETRSPVADPDVQLEEFLMNALRLTEGFSVEMMHQRTGLPLPLIDARLARAAMRHPGHVRFTDGRFALTEAGLWFLDAILLDTVQA